MFNFSQHIFLFETFESLLSLTPYKLSIFLHPSVLVIFLRPGPRGDLCPGNGKEMDICSTQPCRLSKSYNTLLYEQCTNIKNDKWTLYLDRDFEKKCTYIKSNSNFFQGFFNSRVACCGVSCTKTFTK